MRTFKQFCEFMDMNNQLIKQATSNINKKILPSFAPPDRAKAQQVLSNPSLSQQFWNQAQQVNYNLPQMQSIMQKMADDPKLSSRNVMIAPAGQQNQTPQSPGMQAGYQTRNTVSTTPIAG